MRSPWEVPWVLQVAVDHVDPELMLGSPVVPFSLFRVWGLGFRVSGLGFRV